MLMALWMCGLIEWSAECTLRMQAHYLSATSNSCWRCISSFYQLIMWSQKFILYKSSHSFFTTADGLSQHINLKNRLISRKKKPLGNQFFKFWHLWCIITTVMMQIKFNSLFYKLADAVWQRTTAGLRQAPVVLAGQPCSEASGPWSVMSCFVSGRQPWICLDFDLLGEYLVSEFCLLSRFYTVWTPDNWWYDWIWICFEFYPFFSHRCYYCYCLPC